MHLPLELATSQPTRLIDQAQECAPEPAVLDVGSSHEGTFGAGLIRRGQSNHPDNLALTIQGDRRSVPCRIEPRQRCSDTAGKELSDLKIMRIVEAPRRCMRRQLGRYSRLQLSLTSPDATNASTSTSV